MKFRILTTHSLIKNIVYLYLPIKILTVILMIYYFPILFEKRYFMDNDFQNYYSKCPENSYNFFFTKIICFFKIDDLSNYKAISFAFLINFIKDFIFLYIAHKKFPKNLFMVFLIFLTFHPYLNSHYFKFSTILFANLAVALIFFEIEILKKKSFFINLIMICLTGFRNGIFFLVLLYQTLNFYYLFKTLKSRLIKIFLIIFVISVLLILFIYFFRIDYLVKSIITTKSYYLNFFNFNNYLNFIQIDIVRNLLSLILLFFSHLIMLLGFREKAFVEFENYFTNFTYPFLFEFTISIFLFVFHIIGLFYFFKIFNKKDYYVTFLISLLPFLFLVSHLRYFMPYIPLALFGFCMYLDRKILK